MSTESSKQKDTSNELYTLLGTVKFYKVSRPYCTPPSAYTFALTEEEAIEKVRKKYGMVMSSKAREIKEDEFNEFVS